MIQLPEISRVVLSSLDIRRERMARRIDSVIFKCKSSESNLAIEKIRDAAQSKYQSSVEEFIANAKANSIAKKKKKREEMIALFLLLMLDAGEENYVKTYTKLETLSPTTEGRKPSPSELQKESVEFAEARQENLAEFPERICGRFDDIVEEAKEADKTEKEIRAELNKSAEKIKDGEGKRLTQAEAQGCYGAAQIRILERAGFKTALWDQFDRETKRETHAVNMSLGAKPLNYMYPNGQRYPGDPAGGAGECVNCLCVLTGVQRK